MSARNISASVRDRLLNKARAEKLDYNLLLTRYPWRAGAGAGWQMP